VSTVLALSLLLSAAGARVDSVQLSDTGSRTAVRIEWTGTPAQVAVHREGNEARVSMSDAELGMLFSGGSRFVYTTATAPPPAASAPFEGIRIESHPGEVFHQPRLGELKVPEGIDQFYTTDIFLHTWDLSRALGREPDLDETRAAALLAGMQPIDELLRTSGQYGPRVEVPSDADTQTRMLGFIGRDPYWPGRAER